MKEWLPASHPAPFTAAPPSFRLAFVPQCAAELAEPQSGRRTANPTPPGVSLPPPVTDYWATMSGDGDIASSYTHQQIYNSGLVYFPTSAQGSISNPRPLWN